MIFHTDTSSEILRYLNASVLWGSMTRPAFDTNAIFVTTCPPTTFCSGCSGRTRYFCRCRTTQTRRGRLQTAPPVILFWGKEQIPSYTVFYSSLLRANQRNSINCCQKSILITQKRDWNAINGLNWHSMGIRQTDRPQELQIHPAGLYFQKWSLLYMDYQSWQ